MKRLHRQVRAAALGAITLIALLTSCASTAPPKTVSGERIHQEGASRERCWDWIARARPDRLHWELLLDELAAEPEAIRAKSVQTLGLLMEQWPDQERAIPHHWTPAYMRAHPHQRALVRHLNMRHLRGAQWQQLDDITLPEQLTSVTLTSAAQLSALLARSGELKQLSSLTLYASGQALEQLIDQLAASPLAGRLAHLSLQGHQPPAALQALAKNSAKLHRLQALELSNVNLNQDQQGSLKALLSAYAGQLSQLTITRSQSGDVLAQHIAQAGPYPKLKQLTLSYTYLTQVGLRALLGVRMPYLEALDLSGSRLNDPESIKLLATSNTLAGLKRLSLRQCNLIDDSVLWLGYTDSFARLEALDLSRNQLSAKGIWTIFGYGKIRALKHLDLNANHAPGALAALVRAKSTAALESLDARWIQANDEDLSALAAAPTALHTLRLARGTISATGAQALGDSAWLRGLKELDLSEHPLKDQGVLGLIKSGFFPSELYLSQVQLGDEGIRALASSDLLRKVEVLDLRNNQWSHAAAQVFGQTRTLERLMVANLRGNDLGTPDNLGLMAQTPSVLHLVRARVSFDKLDMGDTDAFKQQDLKQVTISSSDVSMASKLAYLPKLGEDVIKSPYLSTALRRYIQGQIALSLRELDKPQVKAQLPGAIHFMATSYMDRLSGLNLERMPLSAQIERFEPDHALEDATLER